MQTSRTEPSGALAADGQEDPRRSPLKLVIVPNTHRAEAIRLLGRIPITHRSKYLVRSTVFEVTADEVDVLRTLKPGILRPPPKESS